jgi:hypothetical protein
MVAKSFTYSPGQGIRRDFFLFPTIKQQLAGMILTKKSFKTIWEGATRSITEEDFATAFWGWYEQCEKCAKCAYWWWICQEILK